MVSMIDRLALPASALKDLDAAQSEVVMNSPEDLIARARNGDQDAFGVLFERHARPVLGFLFNQTGQREVAEELTQETFVRAYRGLEQFQERAKFSTWLFGIARNVAREWSRSPEGQNRFSPAEVDLSLRSPDLASDDLLDKELNEVMANALQLLDDERRMVLALKVFQQRSYQEIVTITGFSLSKVKIELHRARAEMREHLKPYLEIK